MCQIATPANNLSVRPPLIVQADPDQLEQALINLLRNAAEASLSSHGVVVVRWRHEDERALIEILDDGPRPPASDNLFVPFFSTKPAAPAWPCPGAAQAHEGDVSLRGRKEVAGVAASLWLPLVQPAALHNRS